MNAKTIKIISVAGKVAGLVAGGAAYADKLPEKWAAVGIIVFGVSSVLKDTVNRIGDILDDGKENGSFKAQ